MKYKISTLLCILMAMNHFVAQKLLINEISQGISGNREFVELIVNTANPGSCPDPNECVDIRGWIFDDNNGYFSNNDMTGTGVAQGAMRFSNNAMWACLKPGTLIVIYDVSTANSSIPPADLSTSDGNCTLVIPITSTLFERHETRPDPNGNNTYSNSGWQVGGLWSLIAMQNDDDSFQLRDPNNLSVPAYAVSYGNNTTNNFIYFAGPAGGLAFQCVNTVSGDFYDQNNWVSVNAASQSPGAYNSAENEATVNKINAICIPPLQASVTANDDDCGGSCDGTADLILTDGLQPYSAPQWSTSETTNSIQNLCAGDYSVSVTDFQSCTRTVNFTIQSNGVPGPITVSGDVTICEGETTTLTASGPANVNWLPIAQTGLSISVSPVVTTIYTVEDQQAASCYSTNTVTVTVNPKPTISIGVVSNPSACGLSDGQIEILGVGTGNLNWTGSASGTLTNVTLPVTITNLASGTYSFQFLDQNSCLSDVIQQSLSEPNAPPIPIITPDGPLTFCEGGSVTLTSSSLQNNTWSTGETSSSILVSSSGSFTVTVTENGCSSTSAITTVVENPLPVVNAGIDQELCLNEPDVQQVFSPSGGNWSGTNVSATGLISPLQSGNFTLTYTYSDGNCSNSDDISLLVNDLPTVNAGTDFTMCANAGLYDLNAGLGVSPAGGSWTISSSTLASGEFDPLSVPAGNHQITYEIVDPVTNCSNSDLVQITVNPLPSIDAGNDQSICIGQSVVLTATGDPGFSWDNGVTNGVSFTPASSAIYTVSLTDANGCFNSDFVSVSVEALPTVDAGLDITTCGGVAIIVSASGTAVNYTWNNGVSDGVAFIPAVGGTLTVTGTDDNGCSNTDQLTITVNPMTPFDLGPDVINCNGAPVSYTIPNDFQNYLWSDGSTSNSITITSSGQYYVTAFNESPGNIIQNGDFSGGTSTAANSFTTDYSEGVMGAFGLLTNAGTYAISTSPSFVHNNFMNCGDHTTGSGNMLIVNGSGTANTAIWCQTVSVDPNTDYNFSCWAMNVINDPNVSNLQFFINNVQIGDIFSTTPNGCEWNQFNNLWNSGSNTSAQLCIFNQNTVDSGNDLAIDDIFFAPVCSINDTVNVIIENISVDAGPDQAICAGQTATLSATVNVPPSYEELTFTNSADFPIFDNFPVNSDISVTGITTSNPAVMPLVSVCLEITHTYDADLNIQLQSPSGNVIDLSMGNGGSGNNFTGTCFTSSGAPISSGTPPFTGNFSPDQAFSTLDGDNINGTWSLLILDDGSGDIGTLTSWSITFSNELSDPAFTWSPTGGMTDETTLTPSVSPATTTVYTITLTSSSGSCTATDDVTVNVTPGPDPSFSYGQNSYCLSESNPSPTITTVGGVFSSSPAGLVFSDNSGTVDLFQSTVGTYTITYTLAGGCSPNSNFDLTLTDNPSVNPLADITVCENTNVSQIMFTGSSGSQFSWTSNNTSIGLGSSGVGDIASFLAQNGTSGQVSASITVTPSAGGCTGTPMVFAINVNPLPGVNAGSDQTVCSGSAVTLNGSGALTYTWDNGITDGTAFNPTVTQTYTVTGTDANGCQNTDQVLVSIGSSFVLDAGPDQVICLGTSVTLVASAGLNIQWDNGVTDGLAFTPNQTLTYTVTADDGTGCFTSDQVTVTVNPNPVINLENDMTLCEDGNSFFLAPQPTGGSWTGEAVSSSGEFDPSLATTLNSAITLTYTYSDANSCSTAQTMNITVRSLPNIDAGTDINICPDAPITLSGSGGVTYSWDNSVTNGVPFVPVSGTYTVTGTDAFGCINTDQVEVTIGTFDILPIADDTICFGESITVSTGNAVTYTWTPSGQLIQNGATAVITPFMTNTYTVIGQNNLCMDTISFEIVVKPQPAILMPNDTLICSGQPILLTATGNASSYTWENGLPNNSTVNPVLTSYWSVNAELNGCYSEDSILINVEDYPQIVMETGFTESCAPLELQFQATITNAVSQTWNFGDGTSSNQEDPFHSYDSPGYATIELSAVSANGCSMHLVYDSLIHAVIPPVAQFSADHSFIDLENSSVQFLNHSMNAQNYEWDFGDGNTSYEINPQHQFEIFGSQNVMVQLVAHAGLQCSDTTYLVIEVKENLIFYVPNTFTPNDDELNQTFKPIIYSGVNLQNYLLQIYNRWGELIFESRDTEVGWDGTYAAFGPCKTDIYTWKILFETTEEIRQIHSGHVNLIK